MDATSGMVHTLVGMAANVGDTAHDAALQAIERAGVIQLSLEDQERFAAELVDTSPLGPCHGARHSAAQGSSRLR